jgi:hypothetical protein
MIPYAFQTDPFALIPIGVAFIALVLLGFAAGVSAMYATRIRHAEYPFGRPRGIGAMWWVGLGAIFAAAVIVDLATTSSSGPGPSTGRSSNAADKKRGSLDRDGRKDSYIFSYYEPYYRNGNDYVKGHWKNYRW